MECRESYRPGLIFPRLPCLPPIKLFIVPLGQVGGEILLLIQAYQESRGQEGVERNVGVIVVEHGVDLRTGEKLAADLAVFHAQDGSVAASGWGVADPPDTSEAESDTGTHRGCKP